MTNIEPFGYFKAEPFGWTDCADDADGAIPLYDQAAIDALNEVIDAKSIDDRFGGRLAMMLEFMILNPTRFYDEACALIDEYKSAWEEVNPSPPTFMGEPVIGDAK